MPTPDAVVDEARIELKLAAREFLDLVTKALTVDALDSWGGSDAFIAEARVDWAGDEGAAVERLMATATSRDRIRHILGRLSIYLDDAVRDELAGGTAWRAVGPFLRREVARLDGYIDGVYRAGADRSASAADGRKAQGRQTEQRIAGLVQPYRLAGRTRADAARMVADRAGLSEESLIKRLSKMYPGEIWAEIKSGS